MKIYDISIDDYGYDRNDQFIIVANNENEVRELAMSNAADEGANAWTDADLTKEGNYTGKETKPFILCKSFNAG